ncbi:fused MFS/spermidine synthase [Nocardiopsis composta]|uniref:SAM-dependent methyltransferase n=1 Tax=Nocardiopsis composta TaxID=157465 RepID=A0A7W8QLU8_9ACTN|nr:fused MFS/spermidine synthase [Nocardiopsis composta]MBB5432389.1 SAM-dependent methyltransferase [Nocardiopsis composta]
MTTTEQTPPASTAAAPVRAAPYNVLFTAAILLSALLLFAVQPMVSKVLLPPYGGAAAVWTTSLLFFQTVLLIGYAYSHYAPRLLGRYHPLVHAALVLTPLAVLPIALPAWASPDGSAPVAAWLLLVLTAMVGLPFAVLSTTGPLIQAWYARLGLPRSDDPYFLYAASNVGSLTALIAYPFVVEPLLGIGAQAGWWAAGYGCFAVLMLGCVLVTLRRAKRNGGAPAPTPAEEDAPRPAETAPPASERAVTWRRRLLWIGLSALPSSLMQGATGYMSTDVAAVPLLWVIPLALFLLTYIIAFGVRRHGWVGGAVDVVLIGMLPVLFLSQASSILPIPVAVLATLAMLTAVSLACHGLLAADRPAPARLTEFFLITSLGGALGSLFNGVIAPLVFDRVLEYPLALIASALLALAARNSSRVLGRLAERRAARLTSIFLAGVLLMVYLTTEAAWVILAVALATMLAAMLTITRARARAIAFGVAGLALLVNSQFIQTDVVESGRTFFGSYMIREEDGVRRLAHGTTVHGFQPLDPEQASEPTSYYSRTGPVGDLFAAYGGDAGAVGVVGLGTGAIAAYGEDGQRFDFYEIDPEMVRIAEDPERFTYLSGCACDVRTVVGDGRLKLGEAPEGEYDVILLDAFTSDAIPTHMLTREALAEFAERLAPGGVLAVHVSNRNLELAPMVGATSAEAGLEGVVRYDPNTDTDGGEANPLATSSEWIALAPDAAALEPLTRSGAPNAGQWSPLPDDGPVWTDSYSSLLGILK